MKDPLKSLIDELCSRVDDATILSIASDYDLQKPEDRVAVREVLLAISENVEAEEATGFNPSGFGGSASVDIPRSDDAGAEATSVDEGDFKSNDGLTSTTESSRPRSLLSDSSPMKPARDMPGIIHVSVLDSLTDEEKERRLAAMFISLKPIDIKLTLQKTKGDADLAMDELLNLQWLEQTGQRPKGVDGFYVSDDDVPKAKKKGRRKMKATTKAATPKNTNTPTSSEESNGKETADTVNIGFIASRFALPSSEAKAIYERENSSVGSAIVAIVNNYISLGLHAQDSHERLRLIEEQKQRIPWIDSGLFSPIFNTTATTQDAIDVVDVLARFFEKPAWLKHDISYNVVAPDVELVVEAQRSTPVGPLSPSSPSSSKGTALQDVGTTKAQLAAASKHSYATASAAFKKGRSDPLMRQAGAFYAGRARAEAAGHRAAVSVEAALRVDAQSTPDTIDLHGVPVQDGVDIALDRVRRWWDARGDAADGARAAVRSGGGGGGLKVVTGLGRHNPDGKSRLRINVFKALVADGWKVEVLTGAYLVTGRTR